MPDTDFEKAFGTLAYAELEQKAPGLFPYLVGFQMVKKNDDNTHAVGVFGFKVGDQWFYNPVFWLNGKIKGYDLLYIVSQDLFVPMQESWINYLTNRRPYVMGEVEDNKPDQLGVLAPDFSIFSESPLTKGSAVLLDSEKYAEWCKPSLMFKPPNHEKFASLDVSLTAVLERNPEFTTGLLATMKSSTKFADAVYMLYKPIDIFEAAQHAKQAAFEKQAAHSYVMEQAATGQTAEHFISGNDTKVKVIYGPGEGGESSMNSLSAEEREEVMRGNAVVYDEREDKDVSQIYAKPDFERTLMCPEDSGVWSILKKDGKFVDAIVIKDPKAIGEANVPRACVVFDPESKEVINIQQGGLYARQRVDPEKWMDMFDSFSSLDSISVGDVGIVIDERRKGSYPFWVKRSTTNENGDTVLCVEPLDCIKKAGRGPFTPNDDERYYKNTPYGVGGKPEEPYSNESTYVEYKAESSDSDCSHVVQISDDKFGMHNVSDTLMVSRDDSRFVKLDHVAVPTPKGEADDWVPTPKEIREIENGTLKLGTPADIDRYLFKKGMHTIKVHSDGDSEFAITYRDSKTPMISKAAAVKNLVEEVGLREADALMLLKNAFVNHKHGAKGLVREPNVKEYNPLAIFEKKAENSGASAITFDDNYQTMTQYPNTEVIDHPSNAPRADIRDSYKPIDPVVQRNAITAGQSGQKEVFDMSVLNGLIKTHDISDKIDDLLKDVVRGNDRIGRILFLYYWHYDKFVEQFGEEDMRELEDNMRNVFRDNGDLILFLRQKSITPGAFDRKTVDIGDAPAAAGI